MAPCEDFIEMETLQLCERESTTFFILTLKQAHILDTDKMMITKTPSYRKSMMETFAVSSPRISYLGSLN